MRLSRFVGNIVYTFPQAEIANPLPISPCFQVKATLRRIFERVRRWEHTGVRDLWRTLSKRSISDMPPHPRARQKGVQASIVKPPRTRGVLNIRERSWGACQQNISGNGRVKLPLRRVFERVRRWERTGVRDQWRTLSKRSISGSFTRPCAKSLVKSWVPKPRNFYCFRGRRR